MKEYRQPKESLKKQISLLLPIEVYDGAKRDAQRHNRSMAYHIVETLRLSFDKAINEVLEERELAAKAIVLRELQASASQAGKSEAYLRTLETVFNRFAEVKSAEEFTEAFKNDVLMFADLMQCAK